MKVSEEVILPEKPGIRDQDLRMELVDYGSTCGKTASIELPRTLGVRDQPLKLELSAIGTPTNIAAVILPKKPGIRDQDLKLELVPIGCDSGGLSYCTCFVGTVSGVGNWGDFNHSYSQSFSESWTEGPPSYGNSYWSSYSLTTSKTYSHSSTSHIKTTDWLLFNSTDNGSFSDASGSGSYSNPGSDEYWMRNTQSVIRQRGNQFYGNPWFLGTDLELNYSLNFNVQLTKNLDNGLFIGNSYFLNKRIGLSDERKYQTDYNRNERYLGGGFSGTRSAVLSSQNKITLDDENLDFTSFISTCDFFSPADLIIDGVTLDEDTTGYSSIKHGFMGYGNGLGSSYRTWDGLAQSQGIKSSSGSEVISTMKKVWPSDDWVPGPTNTWSGNVKDMPDDAYWIADGFIENNGLVPVSHNSYCFVLHLGIHIPHKYEAEDSVARPQTNGTIDDADLFAKMSVNYTQVPDPDNFSVGWGLYVVGCEQVYGPFSVSGHLTKYYEEVPDTYYRSLKNDSGAYVKHELKEKILLSDNEDDIDILETLIEDFNKSPQETAFTQVQPRKELGGMPIFQSQHYDFESIGGTPTRYKWAVHTKFYDTDWLGDQPFNFSAPKKRCEHMPPDTCPNLRLWVYALDADGATYPRGGVVRMDWSFTNQQWQAQHENPATFLERWKDGSYIDTPVPEDLLSSITLKLDDDEWVFTYVNGGNKTFNHNTDRYGRDFEYNNHFYNLRDDDNAPAPLPLSRDLKEKKEDRASPIGNWHLDGDKDKAKLFKISDIDPDCDTPFDSDLCPPLIARHKE